MFNNYDSYLEAPYQAMCEESERFYDWCDESGIDPDSPDAEDAYLEWVEATEEEIAVARYEAWLENKELDNDFYFENEASDW